ncbi:hypothetical protein [Nocardia sp. NPDC050435]|uniref:hypothetical protein n=1 Tax=Nocardia sp. NPDC050435 TaxID=3155040 RepID=UPI0033EBE701
MWLYGHHVAHLTEPSTYRYKLEFTDEALDVFGQGARVLSLALPFGTKAVADAKGRPRCCRSVVIRGPSNVYSATMPPATIGCQSGSVAEH